jgi:hypothetical protein
MHEPSFSHSLERLGCFAGTFRPSFRHIRSTRLWFTLQLSFLSIAVILRYLLARQLDDVVCEYSLVSSLMTGISLC